MTDSKHRELVRRYFYDVHRSMQVGPMDALFDPDMTLHAADGRRVQGLHALKDILQRQLWPLLKPGSMVVEIVFLPLEEGDRARHPEDPSALVKFRARLAATRRVAHEEFGTVFTHEVTNVWRIHNGRCAETWPAFNASAADRDVMARVGDRGPTG